MCRLGWFRGRSTRSVSARDGAVSATDTRYRTRKVGRQSNGTPRWFRGVAHCRARSEFAGPSRVWFDPDCDSYTVRTGHGEPRGGEFHADLAGTDHLPDTDTDTDTDTDFDDTTGFASVTVQYRRVQLRTGQPHLVRDATIPHTDAAHIDATRAAGSERRTE